MPAKNTAFNTRCLFMNLQASHDRIGSRVVVSLDAAKAFDSVEWQCPHSFGFVPNFVKWLTILYDTPQATVVANGLTYDATLSRFQEGRGRGAPFHPSYMHWM